MHVGPAVLWFASFSLARGGQAHHGGKFSMEVVQRSAVRCSAMEQALRALHRIACASLWRLVMMLLLSARRAMPARSTPPPCMPACMQRPGQGPHQRACITS